MTPFKFLFILILVLSESLDHAHAASMNQKVTINPYIQMVKISRDIEKNGDFLRVILMNTEENPCLTLEKVNLRGGPKIVQSMDLCLLNLGTSQLDLKLAQDTTYEDISFEKQELRVKMSVVPAGTASSEIRLECSLIGKDLKSLLHCKKL